jgi:hypothetical protein
VAHVYNPSYLGSRDQEDFRSKPVPANSSRPYLENTQHKKTAGGMAQVAELSKHKALSSNPSIAGKKKKFSHLSTKNITSYLKVGHT